MNKWLLIFAAGFGLISCQNETPKESGELPILGQPEEVIKMVDGKEVLDTIIQPIPAFAFVNQDSQMITEQSVADKIYVADFFFTSCPTICPIMKKNMLKVYEEFQNEPDFMILSHSIDPRNDTVARLKSYAEKLEIEAPKWNLLHGQMDDIYPLAKFYMVNAMEDKTAPGGYLHSGAFLLVDQNRNIRGFYDGTIEEDVAKMRTDIKKLLSQLN